MEFNRKIIIQIILLYAFTLNCWANGVSFYEKVAVEKNGGLIFKRVHRNKLPQSQKILLSCYPYKNKSCIPSALKELEKELLQIENKNLISWKLFLIGTVYLQHKEFDNALKYFKRLTDFTDNPSLKAATYHRITDIYIILKEEGSAIKTIKRLQQEFPQYKNYNMLFSTYPNRICEAAWWICNEPTNFSKLIEVVPLLKQIKQKRLKLKHLSNTSPQDDDGLIKISTKLGQLKEKICPTNTMYNNVCPESLNLYRDIYQEYKNNINTDYAFYKIQQSQFAYEYEGDEVARSKDIIRLYGPFLAQYPSSNIAPKIRKEYNLAKKILMMK